jgi:hypothetical protein
MASINVNNLPAKAAAAITTADQVMTFTASGDTTQTPFNEAVAQANTLNANAALTIASVTIPTAEVLTLFTTPVPFGITVPVGYFIQPLGMSFRAENGTTAYDTNIKLAARYIGSDKHFSAASGNWVRVLESTINRGGLLAIDGTIGATTTDTQILDATDIEIYVETGNPLNGDSDITITMVYILIPTP